MSLWTTALQVAAIALGTTGAFFFLAGTIGLVRLPDFYSRAHATAKCDTVGAGAILLALALMLGLDDGGIKVLGLVLLVLIASPTASHALARAAFRTGLEPWAPDQAGGETDP